MKHCSTILIWLRGIKKIYQERERKIGAYAGSALHFNSKNQRLFDKGKFKFLFEFKNGDMLRVELYEHSKV